MCREWERETKTCLLYACALHWPSNYALHKWMKNVFTKKNQRQMSDSTPSKKETAFMKLKIMAVSHRCSIFEI